jgi:hypothetical protein
MRPWLLLLTAVAACAPHSSSLLPTVATVPADTALAPATPSAVTEAEPLRTAEDLSALLAEYDHLVATNADALTLQQTRDAVDRMAAQKDAYVSRLFWFTDLEAAKLEAQKTGRPILSLRLLGRLDDELSCANSRLFRLVLYANAEVSSFLRDHYVLYWSSERPVPRMTIDFGDGRAIERTLTGNSIHYVLDARGRLVDALPGLYGPAAFVRGLRQSLEIAQKSAELSDAESARAVAKYHARARWVLTANWKTQLRRVYKDYDAYVDKADLPSPPTWGGNGNLLYASLPASEVNALTVSKADLEAPSLRLLQPEIAVSSDWGDWTKVAKSLRPEHLDARSIALITSKHPRDWSTPDAGELDEAHLAKRLEAFTQRLTEEEARNEFSFHGVIHVHLSRAEEVDWTKANAFVYDRLFMTPSRDSWLGLTPTNALTGISDDGLLAKSAIVVNAL